MSHLDFWLVSVDMTERTRGLRRVSLIPLARQVTSCLPDSKTARGVTHNTYTSEQGVYVFDDLQGIDKDNDIRRACRITTGAKGL